MLHIRDLSHTYPNGTHALDAVSLDIPPGMFGLLGPNGAGKSTLMRCIATLQIPSGGEIRFDAADGPVDVLRQPERLRAQLGYLPQDFGVYPRVSAQDLLDHLAVLKGIAGRGERKETVERLLQQVNLWAVRKKAVAGFSGGMRQRFGIAQALIGNPQLIIVDEPTAGLDPEERNRFNTLLAEIGQSVVVILSTHIVDDVTDLCPRMAVMAGGRIVASGEPRALIRALEGRIWSRAVERESLAAERARVNVIATRLREGRTVVQVLADACPGDRYEPLPPTLEDVYFATLQAHRQATEAPPAAAARAA
jgi:ABC-2 type transport system ATP-binding protein